MFYYSPTCNINQNTAEHVVVRQYPPNDGNLVSIPLMLYFETNNPDSNARIPAKIRVIYGNMIDCVAYGQVIYGCRTSYTVVTTSVSVTCRDPYIGHTKYCSCLLQCNNRGTFDNYHIHLQTTNPSDYTIINRNSENEGKLLFSDTKYGTFIIYVSAAYSLADQLRKELIVHTCNH